MCAACDMTFVGFAVPQLPMLASYVDALKRIEMDEDARSAELAKIAADPQAFLATLADDQPPRTKTLDDGRVVAKLPTRIRWIWDGEYCGDVNLRWQPGTEALPDYCLGHIGYGIVPWKRGHGYAKRALRHILSEAREVHLAHVDLTTAADNVASQKVILANGGVLLDTFTHPTFEPTRERHLYRIML